MKRRSTDTAAARAAAALLRQGLALALQDISAGRAELQQAAAGFQALGDDEGRLLACCALVVFIGIADDDYVGFEAAAAVVAGTSGRLSQCGKFGEFDMAGTPPASGWLGDPGHALLATAGALTAGSFNALDAPGLAAYAAAIAQALSDQRIAAPLRCCAGLAALGYHHIGMDQEGVLWLELALRPLLMGSTDATDATDAKDAKDAPISARLADEAFHMLVQSLYQCEASARAVALREQRRALGHAPLPAIALKLLLLDAQMALGTGHAGPIERGRQALAQAEPLLDPRAPRPAGWWHLLRSRLHLLEGQQRQALTHARLALRLASQSQLPERWMGVTVMQEGQVLMASGAYLQALPFFERAGRAASGQQARFCWCLAHLARALHAFDHNDVEAGKTGLASGLALAREMAWFNFFRAVPKVAAVVCALALEHGIEAAFARETIVERGLAAMRPDLAAWPWPIRVHTFGGLRIEIDGQALVFKGKVAKKPLELLLFVIASSGSDVSLATVAFALWRELDGDKARAALNVALHRLRKLLGNDDALLLEHGRLSLNPQRVWVDCLAFEQLADSVGLPAVDTLAAPARAAAERAQALYRGPFLHDSEDEAWQMVYRSRLESKFKRMVTLLARAAVARGDSAAARALLARGLEFDALAEDLARELMRELIDAGEQAAALAVYERCREAVALRLGAQPSSATQGLRDRARGGILNIRSTSK